MACSKYIPVSFENQFADFYNDAFRAMFNLSSSQFLEDVYAALRDIRKVKDSIKKRERKFLHHAKFKKVSYRFAYLYAYGVLHSIMISGSFSQYLQNNTAEISQFLSERKLHLCCLGGGCGLEAIAICKVIENFFLKSKDKKERWVLDVYITVIDICQEWEQNLHMIADTVNKRSSFFSSERIKLHTEFIHADLQKPFTDEVGRAIRAANIVTMIKLVCSIARTSFAIQEVMEIMLKDVIKCMSKESCLLIVDNSGGDDVLCFVETLSESYYQHKIKAMFHEIYTLETKTLKKMENLIKLKKKSSAVFSPTKLTKVSSSFWVKKGEERTNVKVNEEESSSPVRIIKGFDPFIPRRYRRSREVNDLSDDELRGEKLETNVKVNEEESSSPVRIVKGFDPFMPRYRRSREVNDLSDDELRGEKLETNVKINEEESSSPVRIAKCYDPFMPRYRMSREVNDSSDDELRGEKKDKTCGTSERCLTFPKRKVKKSCASFVDARHFPMPWGEQAKRS